MRYEYKFKPGTIVESIGTLYTDFKDKQREEVKPGTVGIINRCIISRYNTELCFVTFPGHKVVKVNCNRVKAV
jgi:hypothetical protein